MDENIEEKVEIDGEGELQVYELGYHILPSISEEEVTAEVAKLNALIAKNKGEIISHGNPEMMELAYEMTKRVETRNLRFNKAYFAWVKFEMDSSKILDIKNKMDADLNILRYLIVKTVKESTLFTPKAPVFKKEPVKDQSPEEGIAIEIPAEKAQAPASEEEIDKSIDELLVNEKLELEVEK